MFACKVTMKSDTSKLFQGHGSTEEEATAAAWDVLIKMFLQTFGEDWQNHPDNPVYPLESEYDFVVKQCRHNGE